MRCSGCGNDIPDDANWCPNCGKDVRGFFSGDVRKPKRRTKSEVLALVLSFLVPGLGQVYGREIARGAIMFVLYAGTVLTRMQADLGPAEGVAIGIQFMLWVYSMYDAYRICVRYNEGVLAGGE